MDDTPTPHRDRRRRRLAALVPLGAVAVYAALFAWMPGFRMYTVRGLRSMGVPVEVRHDPGRRPLIEKDHRLYLWGGAREDQHFDISRFSLEPDQLHYGLGRERFPALIEPAFTTVDEIVTMETTSMPAFSLGPADETDETRRARLAVSPRWPGGAARVLVVRVGADVKIYPLQVLRRHEVVNDVVGDRPIFVAYCYLADLAAAYDRTLGDHALTFAVSGYTYYDPDVWEGRDAFILWDRDTESLWWPPLGRAVSGPLIETPMRVLEPALWSQTTWSEAKTRFPDALVLASTQRFDPPRSWPRLDVTASPATTTRPAGDSIAPPWGANADLETPPGES
jgi:hypothetical protein